MGDDSERSPDALNADNDDILLILGELVSAYELKPEEHVKEKYLRPYCVVKFAGKTIHYSGPCAEGGRDPIWTVSTGSLFLVKVSPKALLRETLQMSIWSKKNNNSLRGKMLCDVDTYFLGQATIDGLTLLSHCNEERVELPLHDLHGNEELSERSIALRFRLATQSDVRLINLMREQGISPPSRPMSDRSFHRPDSPVKQQNPVKDLLLEEGSRLPIAETVTETNESQVAGDFLVDALAFAFQSSTRSDKESGLRKLRVKPGPDPKRVEETKFMTPLQISQETRKPSQRWVDAGSGNIGTLHLEILSCHNLPNVDVGEAVGNLTDCFVCAVFEDVMVQTPVIDDELCPHWLPWTQRAFRIGIVHPSSTLFLGVLDYDLGPGTHEPIGRVAVNLTNFQPDMLYTLKYKLYPPSRFVDRNFNGTITFRIRIEYPEAKAAILVARQPMPVFHVNTRKQKTFKVLRYTCFGEYDIEEKFTWAVTRSYIGEILEYWSALNFYAGECFWSLVFWKGQVAIGGVYLPVHSAMLFFSGAVLVERPWLIVPVYCFFGAWFMLATMSHRRETPSPWHTCNSFLHYTEVLLFGRATDIKKNIRPSEYSKQTEDYDHSVAQWKETYQSSIDSKAAIQEKLLTLGDDNIHTNVSEQVIPLDILERLGRYQGIVGRFCTKLRRIKSIIIWEDSMQSFWITATCLVAGLVTMLLPWRFLLYHIGRIVVWGFLGPHMKFVGIYLQKTNTDKVSRELEHFRKHCRLARIRREEALKLKDMKCLAFGEYVTLVPNENLPRHYDRPLHESSARYVSSSDVAERIPASSRVPGQQLYGVMIPHTSEGIMFHEAEAESRKLRLAEINQQLTRLLTIQERLSSRAPVAAMDQDLPDELGHEVTLFEEKCKGFHGTTNEGAEVTVFQPEMSLRSDRSEFVGSKSQFWAKAASRLVQERNDERDDENESAQSAKSLLSEQGIEVDQSFMTPLQSSDTLDEKRSETSFADVEAENRSVLSAREEQISGGGRVTTSMTSSLESPHEQDTHAGDTIISFMTPSHEPDTHLQHSETIFMTPELCPDVEEKKNDSSLSTLDFLELHLQDSEAYRGRALEEQTSTKANGPRRVLVGPRRQAAVAAQQSTPLETPFYSCKSKLPASGSLSSSASEVTLKHNNHESMLMKESSSDLIFRRTWSSSSLRKDRTWIKENPTDTIFEMQTSVARRISVVGEEGLEVVAMGRLRTIGDEDSFMSGDEDEDTVVSSSSTRAGSKAIGGSHRGLSQPYTDSDNHYVQVATFRP